MALDRIILSTFRNHADTRLEDTRQLNLLIGENGAGKTNVLEAISLFAPGRGLRRAALADMAGETGDGGFAISAKLDTGGGTDPVSLGTGMQGQRPGRRIVQVNGAEASAVSLGEWLAISWLTPAMDRIFADSAGARRRYMDRLALALSPGHARHASRYENALRERNKLLSDLPEPEPAWLDSIETQMALAGAQLAQARARLVEALSAELGALPSGPFARPALTHLPGGALEEDAMRDRLHAGRRRDRAAGRTLEGPHRDELQVVMDAKNMPAAECSTGEQKAMLIAMTLAHADLAVRGRPGLLLLDEVAAHLDPLRRDALFERLRDNGSQVWLTGTERSPFQGISADAATWRISDGTAESHCSSN
ncbi:recombinational DNA repair ATPase [Aurantiacibacter atlanticus]|uniref:DNA replication and repair protein RecF n=1 Tax=Aurantiacibacter atlanticus TaxID=1648404 RepID=A0A0H4VI38_9SPHN|nr:DNA replication/repair protein RecF [Aurantiacibacter atlanticus]AKQ42586.1 recombinational DNA repair ATPase [Aurantiacibacter atlanticus]MDF1834916.1 DNA replication/repair protein RecF [Alteraurantiacibacter sp. bin_em_oilr2.035]